MIARHEVNILISFHSWISANFVSFQWKGLSKTHGALEDYVEKQKLERAERAARRAVKRDAMMPGAFAGESDDEDD